jgi:hypothetical protein
MMVGWLKRRVDDGRAKIVGEVSFMTASGYVLADGYLYSEGDNPGRIKGAAVADNSGTVSSAVGRIGGLEVPIDINQFSVASGGEITLTIARRGPIADALVRKALREAEAERPKTWRELPPML